MNKIKILVKNDNQIQLDKTNNAPRRIIQITEEGSNGIKIQGNHQFVLELNGLADHDQKAKFDLLITEFREQLATLIVNIEDFPNTEWVELAEHDRT